MAVRGLGCPVRLVLTAGQRGDCPQAYPLIEGLPAEVVMAGSVRNLVCGAGLTITPRRTFRRT